MISEKDKSSRVVLAMYLHLRRGSFLAVAPTQLTWSLQPIVLGIQF